MARWLAGGLLGMLLALPAAAQGNWPGIVTEACEHVPPPLHIARERDASAPQDIYGRLHTLMAHRQQAATIAVDDAAGTARWRRPTFELKLRQGAPPRVNGQEARQAWSLAYYTVFVRPLRPGAERRGTLAEDGAILANTLPPRAGPEPGTVIIPLEFEPRERFWRQRWEILVLPCLRTGPDEAEAFAAGFGRAEVTLNSPLAGALVGIGGALLAILILGYAASAINGHQLEAGPDGQKALSRFSPCFICQDAFGHMSLSRFQVLLFTLALLGVYSYAFVLTGQLPEVQPSVLALAGITLGGSTLASAATRPVVETSNRLWLLGNGLLDQPRRRPRWMDLLTGDGEVDITRVQALAFTLFAVGSLVASGAEDLSNFAVPEQLNYLIGISQTVYVAGKALPGDAPRRLNEELRSLRNAEVAVIKEPGSAAAWADFERQKVGVAASLTDVFGERFRREALAELRPGGAAPPPAAAPA